MTDRHAHARWALLGCSCLALALPAHGQSPTGDARPGVGVERAAARYKQSLAANPVEGTALDRLWDLALAGGNSAALLDQYAASARTDIAAALIHGHLLKKAGRLDAAAAAYRHAATLAPTDPRPYLALAELEKSRNAHAAAAAALESGLKLLPADDRRRADALLALGAARLAEGDLARAAEAWEETVRASPRNVTVRERLAATYESNGLPARAIPHQQWIEAHAAEPTARAAAGQALGRLHEACGDFDAARAALERARSLTAPGNWLRAELGSALIRLHERAGRQAELEASWRAAAEKAPRDLGAWLSLVEFYAATGRAEAERAALERAVALAPRDHELSLRLAHLCADAGDLARAAAVIDGLLKIQPANFQLVLERAELDVRLGRLAEASTRVETAVRSRPNDESAAATALAFFQANRLPDATERALRANLGRRPDAPEAALALAGFLCAEKRTAEALAILDAWALPKTGSAAANPAERGERCARAAEFLRLQNRLDDSSRFAEAALQAQPENPTFRLAAGDLALLRGDSTAARAAFVQVADSAALPAEIRETAEQKLFAACRAAAPAPAANPATAGPATASPRRGSLPPKSGTLLGPPVVMRADRRLHIGGGAYGTPRGRVGRSAVADDDPPAVLERVAELEAAAQAEPTAANYLRLARWQSWRRAGPEALQAAQAAAQADNRSVVAHEWVVRLAVETNDRATAAAALATLAQLDPAEAPRYRRQAGHLKLEAGDFDAALSIFGALVESDPGSRENLTALALAQQRAGRWLDAAGTWERAYRLPGKASPSARAEVRSALIGALEHTGQHERAIELLAASAGEETTDRAVRRERFRDLLAYADKHGRLDLVERAHAAALAAHPQDAAVLAAGAAIHRARGRPAEAYALLERALAGAAEPAETLRELVATAEECGDFPGAIRHQRRLAQLDPRAGKDAATWEKLATLEVANLDLDAAVRSWREITARFPRDPDVLTRATDFFENVADQPSLARETLRRVVLIEPHDLARQLRLGRLELTEGGDRESARRAFETIIARTDAEEKKSGLAAIVLPEFAPARRGLVPTRVRVAQTDPAAGMPGTAREEKGDAGNDGEGVLRLLAIGEMSGLLHATPAAARPWIEHWLARSETAPLEALWAFFYAGENALALDVLEKTLLTRQADDAQLQRAFLDLVFAAGDSGRLARWLRPSDAPAEGPGGEARVRRLGAACEAFRRYVPSVETDTLDPALLDALFPETGSGQGMDAPREKLWQTATQTLAPSGRLAEAIRLGERVFASSITGRAACGLQLARWHCALHQPEQARAVLRGCFEGAGPVASIGATDSDDAAYSDECLRAYYKLLPTDERAPFRERFTRETLRAAAAGRHARSPGQRLLSVVLLDGLAGDWPAGSRHLDALFALQPLSDRANVGLEDAMGARRWRFCVELGDRLGNWGFEPLAAHVWRRALADPALVGLGADAALRASALREARARLAIVALNAAPSGAGRQAAALRGLLGPDPPAEALASLRSRLGATGGPVWPKLERLVMPATLPATIWLSEQLCALEPLNAEHWRALLNAYTTAGAVGPLERTLREHLFRNQRSNVAPLTRDRGSPVPRRELALRLADLLENAGDLAGAARVLEIVHEEQRGRRSHENPPVGVPSRDFALSLRLAANFEKQGRFSDAENWCREILWVQPSEPTAALILARVKDALGRPEEGTAALESALAAADKRAAPAPIPAGPGSGSPLGLPRGADELVVALAKRHLANGKSEGALILARSCLRTGRWAAATEIAAAMESTSPENQRSARGLLEAIARDGKDPQTRIAAQRALLQNAALAAGEPAVFEHALRGLRRCLEASRGASPGAWQSARDDALLSAGRKAELENLLRAEWADGRGDPASGAKLATVLARAEPARSADLSAVINSLAQAPCLDEEATTELLKALEEAGQPALTVPLAARMWRRFPQNSDFAFQLARALWHAGRKSEAETLLADVEIEAVFQGANPVQIAKFWQNELGDPEGARRVLERAVARDPGMSRSGAASRRALARAEIAQGHLERARKLLRDANAASAGVVTEDDLAATLDYLDASGQLAAGKPDVTATLGLPVTAHGKLETAAFTRLWASGRPDAAKALVTSHPALLGESPDVAAKLRTSVEGTNAGELEWLIEQLERALASSTGDPTVATFRLAHELATLLDAATRGLGIPTEEGKVSGDFERVALERLRRACQLEPADLPRVRRLGELLAARGDFNAAAALAQALIAAPDAAPADKETARELMQTWNTSVSGSSGH